MTSTTTTYQHHVDPRYFNFLWHEPMYITVEYLADGDKVSIQNLTAPPYLLSAIVMYGGWQALMAEIDESARQHAEKELQPAVHPTIMQALMPFVK